MTLNAAPVGNRRRGVILVVPLQQDERSIFPVTSLASFEAS